MTGIKRKVRMIVGILLIIFCVILFVGLFILQANYNKKLKDLSVNKDSESLLSESKKEEIKQFANKVVDEYPIEGHAMVVVENELISHDQYKRYLVQVSAVAINKEYNTELYTYYVVIQEDQEDKFYVLPFGVEIIKGDEDHLKREIMISMMKVVNGWGNSSWEFEERWSKALLMPKSRTQVIKDKRDGNQVDLNTIYYTQGVLKHISDYLLAYKEAVESGEFVYIQSFLVEDKDYSKKQYQELKEFKRQNISRELINSQVIGITLPDNKQECLIVTQIDSRIYLPNEIVSSSERVTYKVGSRNGEIRILDVIEVE